MRILLDTHAVIWAFYKPERLPPDGPAVIGEPANTVFFSAVTAWEIAIKEAIGKLRVDLDRLVGLCMREGFEQLPVTIGHAQALRRLERHHTDPFDRLLVAQSVVEGCTLVTRDPVFASYGVPTWWGS